MLQLAPRQIWVLFFFPQILLEAPHHTDLGWGRFLPSVFLLFPLFSQSFSCAVLSSWSSPNGTMTYINIGCAVFILDPFNTMKHQAYFTFYLLLFGWSGSVSFLSHRKSDRHWDVGYMLLGFTAKKEKKQDCYTVGSGSPGGMYALKPEVLHIGLLPLTLHWSAAGFWARTCMLHGGVGPFLPSCHSGALQQYKHFCCQWSSHSCCSVKGKEHRERCDLSKAPTAETWPPPSSTNCCHRAAALIQNASSFTDFH